MSDLGTKLSRAVHNELLNSTGTTHQAPFAVIVSNIPPRVKADDVKGFLSHFGAVVDCRLFGKHPNLTAEVVFSTHGLLTTVAYKPGPDAEPIYALEGSIAVAGSAIQWCSTNIARTLSPTGSATSSV